MPVRRRKQQPPKTQTGKESVRYQRDEQGRPYFILVNGLPGDGPTPAKYPDAKPLTHEEYMEEMREAAKPRRIYIDERLVL